MTNDKLHLNHTPVMNTYFILLLFLLTVTLLPIAETSDEREELNSRLRQKLYNRYLKLQKQRLWEIKRQWFERSLLDRLAQDVDEQPDEEVRTYSRRKAVGLGDNPF